MTKTAAELGSILFEMYKNAPKKEQVTMVHLFGVQFYDQILRVGIKEVIDEAGIHSTYRTELSKAVKLAKYVTPLQLQKS